MRKPDIAKQMARQAGVSRAEAAVRLDGVVRQVLADLRKHNLSECPGLGRFRREADGTIVFEPSKDARHD